MFGVVIGILSALHFTASFEANCSSKFSDLGYSISTVICPAGCWRKSHSLCGTGTYGDGPVCLAAIHAGVVSDCGGVAHVYETTGFTSSRGSLSHTVKTTACGSRQKGYTFQMTCHTTGNTEFAITKVTCPSNCQSNYVCGNNFYTSNSSVCAAAIHSGITSSAGGQVTFYRRQGQRSHRGSTNHGIAASTCSSSKISFNFFKIDDCVSSPCQNGGTCIDLLADYGCICTAGYKGKSCEQQPYLSCADTTGVGIRTLVSGESVYCSNKWRIFQRRIDGSIPDFNNKTWEEYAQGFGKVDGEFWLGLRKLHSITKNGGCRFRADLEDRNETAFAVYSQFSVADETALFRITVGGYSGTAGDAFNYRFNNLNGMSFTTVDKDNDGWPEKNCAAAILGGGWWHNKCSQAFPNGLYGEIRSGISGRGTGARWYSWKSNTPMKSITLGVRCF